VTSLNVRPVFSSNELLSVLDRRRSGESWRALRGNNTNCILEIPLILMNARFQTLIDNFNSPPYAMIHLEILKSKAVYLDMSGTFFVFLFKTPIWR